MTADKVTALLTALPRTLVGDGKTPNIHFVTNTETGNTIAVFVGDDPDIVQGAIEFTDRFSEPLMVEDRLSGVVYDNEAGEALQRRLAAEEGYEG